ncbi:LppU/SCO3897 family protein [Nocardia sp. NPDC004722]
MRWAVAVSALLLALFTGGCALVGGTSREVSTGDCLRKGDDGLVKASCSASGAGFVVLGRVASGGTENGCVNVAGTEYVETEDSGASLCIGAKGADVAHAVNVAKVGSCVDGNGDAGNGEAVVHQVDCADPAAVYRVLARLSSDGSSPQVACARIPGTQATYGYVFRAVTGVDLTHSFGTGIVFCLAANNPR